MATTVTNHANELLWQPNDFGSYSVEKIQVISDILSELLQSFSIDTNIKVDDETLSLFYTKEEINDKLERYVNSENATPLIQGLVDVYIETLSDRNILLTTAQYEYIISKLLYLYHDLYKTDLDLHEDTSLTNIALTTKINSLENLSSGFTASIYALQSSVYEQSGSSGFSNSTRFYTKSEIDDKVTMLQNAIDGKGSAGVYATWEAHNTLASTVTDLQGRVNTNEGSIRTINSTLSSHESAISNKLDTSSFNSHILEYSDYVSSNDDRVDALEERDYIKSVTFTGNTDMNGVIGYSDISDFGITDGSVIISVDFAIGTFGTYRRVDKYNFSNYGYALVFYGGNTFGSLMPISNDEITCTIYYI